MTKDQSIQSKVLKMRLGAFGLALGLGLTGYVAGCGGGGGGGGGGGDNTSTATTRTFYSKYNSVLIGNNNLVDVGRGFVTLQKDSNVPVAVGLELTSKAVNDLPLPQNFNTPTIYGINLPAESVYTPYSYIAISYWSSHSPTGIGDQPHFHPLFGIDPPQAPTAECGSIPKPVNCIPESIPADTEEIPKDYVIGSSVPEAGDDTIAPGIGLAYEDTLLPQPQLLPGWSTVGQNYFFYKGRMNGVGLAATNGFLKQQERGNAPAVPNTVKIMKQPRVYPKAGYYPNRYDVTYDAKRKVHIFTLSDFRLATNVASTTAK